MGFRIFLSHSTRDQGLVISLSNLLARMGIEVFVAEWYLAPGELLAEKIFKQIESSDGMVVLLTRNGVRSNWVQQEIGIALKSDIPIIPLVEKGVPQEDLGALQGREWIEYDRDQPLEALVRTSTYVSSLKMEKEKREKTSLIAAGVVAFFLLMSGSKK